MEMKGYYFCGKCRTCHLNILTGRKVTSFNSACTGKSYDIQSFITYSTQHVMFLIWCPCGLDYVGRTTWALSIRLGGIHCKHYKEFPWTVSKHYALKHDKNPTGTIFIALEKYIPHWRGGDPKRSISRAETSWIYWLKSYSPMGLNIEWDIHCYINNS